MRTPHTAISAAFLAGVAAFAVACGGGQPPAPASDTAAPEASAEAPPETGAAPVETAQATPPAQQAPAPAPKPAPANTPEAGGSGGHATPTSGAEGSSQAAEAKPAPRMLTIPAGKRMKVNLDTPLSTATSQVGQGFSGTVSKTMHLDSGTTVALLQGTKVEGTVQEVVSAKRVKGTARMVLAFNTIVLPDGSRVSFKGSLQSEAEATKKKDTATIAGSAVGGAILGTLIGKDAKGAAIGAIAGGAIGTGVVLGTKGEEVEIPVGTPITIQIDEAVSVPAPNVGG